MAHVVTFTEILRRVADIARQGTGARLSFVGQPAQKPSVPFVCWVDFVSAQANASAKGNHSTRSDDGHVRRMGITHQINATIVVMVGVFSQPGPDEQLSLAQASQDLMCAFEADETLRGTGNDDLVASCTLGTVTITREAIDDVSVYSGVTAPITIFKTR